MSAGVARTECRTPTGGTPTSIPVWKFDALRTALLAVVPDADPGIPFSELPDRLRDALDARTLDELGSLGWHLTTVKLELEVRGELRRLPGRGPQRLVRTV